jgi:hypothetical protein
VDGVDCRERKAADMNKAPGRSRRRRYEHQFRRIYPT